jgi:periplasmic copper chaperone A
MKLLPLAATIVLALAGAAVAHGYKLAGIEITHPYISATLPGARTAAAYMILDNSGAEADRLLRIETDAAVVVEFHQTVVTDGVSRMLPIEGGLEIPSGGEYRLGADGSHAMLVDLAAPIGLGQLIEATLHFEKAGSLDIVFEVEPVGTTLEGAEAAHKHE